MKTFTCTLFASIFALTLPTSLFAFNGTLPGSGTQLDPYLIEDYLDFMAFTSSDNAALYWNSGTYTTLNSDINFTEENFSSALIAPDTDPTEDFQGIPFQASFDGNGHTISNLKITGAPDDFIGLFGMIGPDGIVKNLGVDNINITASSSSINIGGLAAQNSGSISNCYTKGYIKANDNAGGLCGTNYSGTISNCYSTVSMVVASSSYRFGGFCGYNRTGAIIDKCYFAGNVTFGTSSTYMNSFCGYNSQSSPATISNCFWDADVCDWPYDEGYATESNTAEMKTKTTFTDAGWDFSYSDGSLADWAIYPGSYPKLAWENTVAYSGETTLYKEVGSTNIQFAIDIFCSVNQTIGWTVTGHEESFLVDSISTETGSSTGPDDITTLIIYCTDFAYPIGSYSETLTITAGNGDSIDIPLKLNIYRPVNLTDFAQLAQFWLNTDCDLPEAPCAAADFYIDGSIDISDLNLFTENWLGIETPYIKPTPFDGFESGDFSALPWVNSDDAPWTVVTDSANDGSYSAKSGPIPGGGTYSSLLQLTIDTELTNISFAVKTQCSSYFTKFYFYIDDEAIETFNGMTDWQTKTYEIEPGEHKFRWFYMNMSPDNDPEKCAWIDDIKLY